MRLEIKIYKNDNKLYYIAVKTLLEDEIQFIFRNIYLLQSEKLVIRTPFIKTNNGKKLAFIFSTELKNYIAYHIIKNFEENNTIYLDWKNNQNINIKKVNEFERNYGLYETKGIYNIFIGKCIQIKHLNLIFKNNKYNITFPNNGSGKDICFPSNTNTKELVMNKILKSL